VSLPLILLFRVSQQPQLVIPLSLERIRYEAVARIHFHVPSLGQTGFVTSPLDLCLLQGDRLLRTVSGFRPGLPMLLPGPLVDAGKQ